jgi:tRNA (guanine-N7-)-methyltransferase
MSGKRSRISSQVREFAHTGIFHVGVEGFIKETLTWEMVFERVAPIDIELGFGKGEFLLEIARRNPERNFIGFEIDPARMKWAECKAHREGFTNIRFVAGDAMELLPVLFKDNEVSRAYMNFPDPWPKNRHAKKRMIGYLILDEFVRIVKPGGDIYVVTDVDSMALVGLNILESHKDSIENLNGVGVIATALEGYPVTIHEMKFRKEGRNINFMHYRKL